MRALVEEVPSGEIPDLIGELARAKVLAESRLHARIPTPRPESDGDRILNVQEVTDLIGLSPKWVYSHADELGGFKIGGSLRFSEREVRRYISLQRRRT